MVNNFPLWRYAAEQVLSFRIAAPKALCILFEIFNIFWNHEKNIKMGLQSNVTYRCGDNSLGTISTVPLLSSDCRALRRILVVLY